MISSILQRIASSTSRNEVVSAVRGATQSLGVYSPEITDAALAKVLSSKVPPSSQEPALAPSTESGDSDTSHACSLSPEHLSSQKGEHQAVPTPAEHDLDSIEAASCILQLTYDSLDSSSAQLVMTPTAWRAKLKVAQSRGSNADPASILAIHSQYMAHPDLVPYQHLTVMHIAAFNALAAALRPLPSIDHLLGRILNSPNCPQDPAYLAIVHSAAISTRTKLKDINGAYAAHVRLVDSMGLVPRRSAISALIQAVVQRHQPTRFRRLVADVNTHAESIRPDVQLANQIVRGLCMFDSVDAGAQFVAATYPAWSLTPDPITYAFLVQAAIDQGEPDRANSILQGMKAQGIGIGWQAYRPLVVAAAKAGDLVALDRVLTQIKADAQDVERELPRIADVIVAELMHAKHTAMAETFLAHLPATMRSVSVYNAYINQLVSSGAADKDGQRMHKALHVYHHDMPAAGIAPDGVTLNTLVAGLAHRKEYTMAMQLLKDAKVPVTSLSYNPLLLAAAKDKDAKVFSAVEATMREHGIPTLDAVGMDAKVECYVGAGDLETALQVVAQMDKPTVKTHLVLLEAMSARVKANTSPYEKRVLRRAMDQILTRVEAAHNELGKTTFAILLHLLASKKLDRPQDAIRIYLQLADQFAVTKSIASAVLRATQRTNAPATAKTVVQRWTQKEQFAMHATLNEMYLDTLAAAGWLDDAVSHLTWMKEHKWDMDSTHLAAITRPLMRAGQPEAARKVANHLVQVFPDLKSRPACDRGSHGRRSVDPR